MNPEEQKKGSVALKIIVQKESANGISQKW